jgi:hypothetical protein
MRRFRRVKALFDFCLIAATALVGARAQAAMTVVSNPEDLAFRALGGTIQGSNPTILGSSANQPEPGNRTVVYVFQLPASDTGLNVINGANFKFTIASASTTPTYGVDLYAISARQSPNVLITDNYFGPLQTEVPLTGATERIVDNLLPAGAPFPIGELSTDFSTGSPFVNFLNAQYGVDGSGAGKYIFLRLNADQTLGAETTGGTVHMSETPTGKPTLTLSFVPEPSLALAGTAIFALRMLSRRRPARV